MAWFVLCVFIVTLKE